MELVVDANILFSFFKKDSTVKELVLDPELKYGLGLFSPELVLKEIGKHKNDVCLRFRLAPEDFDVMFASLSLFITIGNEFNKFVPEATKLISPHTKDVPYVALLLSLKTAYPEIGIWSNDKALKALDKQGIRVFSTAELVAQFKGFKL